MDSWLCQQKNPHENAFFSHMRIFMTAESISTKFCTSTPLAGLWYIWIVIQIGSDILGDGVQNLDSPIDFGISF